MSVVMFSTRSGGGEINKNDKCNNQTSEQKSHTKIIKAMTNL